MMKNRATDGAAPGPALTLALAAACAVFGCRSAEANQTRWLAPAPAPQIAARSVRQTGSVRLEQLSGRVVMLSFGYSHCLDVCPVTLATMHGVLQRLGAGADAVAPVYVSIDPDRDTPGRLRAFVDRFDDRIDGWTVSGPELPQALAAYGVSAARRPIGLRGYLGADADPARDYALAHGGGIWLIDARGRLRARYAHAASPELVARGIERLLHE